MRCRRSGCSRRRRDAAARVEVQAQPPRRRGRERNGGFRPEQQPSKLPPGDVRAVPVQGNVYMIVGAGTNIAVQVGEDGVLVVDTGAHGDRQGAGGDQGRLRERQGNPLDGEHVVSAGPHRRQRAVSKAGRTVNGNVADIVAHENAAARMVTGQSARLGPAVQHLLRGDARLPVQRRTGRALSSMPRSPIRTRW